jgi:hypothetical protein
VAQMRIGMPSAAPSRHLKPPTAMATRYDDIFSQVANLTVCCVMKWPGRRQRTVRDGDIAAVDGQADGERRRRPLVEARKARRVSRLRCVTANFCVFAC